MAFLTQYNEYSFFSFILTILGTLSTAVTLYMIFYGCLFIFAWSKQWILYLSMFLFIFTDISLIIDFFIYKLFHFHINAMVMNIITSPDALDSIQTGVLPFIISLVLIILFILFEYRLIQKISNIHLVQKKDINKRINRYIILPFLIIIFIEKLSFGMATLFSKNQLIAPFKVIPLYQPLTFNRIAAKYFGFEGQKQALLSIKTHSEVKYPLTPIQIEAPVKPFHIFILASDSVRFDIINAKNSPNIVSFAKDALVFNHHYSGGNSTRFGIFSLIYGLNATYWFSFLNSNQKPILFDVLQQQKYHINIISSTNTNWPEFRKTCYVNIQKNIHDTFQGEPWEKDAQATAYLIRQIKHPVPNQKHFSFLFLDAPHGYSYPPHMNINHAKEGEINYLTITKESEELQTVIKRYKNAVTYNDMLFGNIISTLKKENIYDNSLIIYTSDHGQEFFEQGNFGHNTAFSQPQLHVPLMIKLPKSLQNSVHTKSINLSLTSHQDIVPSLLSLVGVKNNPKTYSNGLDFFSHRFHRDYVFASNWNHNALITTKNISVFSNLPNEIFNTEVRDAKTYTLYPTRETNNTLLLNVIHENTKFLQ